MAEPLLLHLLKLYSSCVSILHGRLPLCDVCAIAMYGQVLRSPLDEIKSGPWLVLHVDTPSFGHSNRTRRLDSSLGPTRVDHVSSDSRGTCYPSESSKVLLSPSAYQAAGRPEIIITIS